MNFCASNKQIADIFTKALIREQFEKNRNELGLIKTTSTCCISPNDCLVKRFQLKYLNSWDVVNFCAVISTCEIQHADNH